MARYYCVLNGVCVCLLFSVFVCVDCDVLCGVVCFGYVFCVFVCLEYDFMSNAVLIVCFVLLCVYMCVFFS